MVRPSTRKKRKPPVVLDGVTLSGCDQEVLSKNPGFAVRVMMSKERFMVDFEKGMVKKLYSDIGKEIVDGVTVEEVPIDDDDKRIMKEAEWQERKSQLIYGEEVVL